MKTAEGTVHMSLIRVSDSKAFLDIYDDSSLASFLVDKETALAIASVLWWFATDDSSGQIWSGECEVCGGHGVLEGAPEGESGHCAACDGNGFLHYAPGGGRMKQQGEE